METQFILIVFVCSGFTPGQQNYLLDTETATTEIANGKVEVQENFRNLLNSLSKNDAREAGTFREILEQEAARERQAFNMVEEVEIERRRNARKQKNFLNNRISDGKATVAFKRERRAKYYKTTLSDSEQRKEWNEEFARLQTATRSKFIEEYFSKLEEEKKNTQSTPEIELYSPSAERRYWWDSLADQPDYPSEPHIKAGMFTGTTLTWPEEKTEGTTKSTTFRFTQFKHKIPSRMIGNQRHVRQG